MWFGSGLLDGNVLQPDGLSGATRNTPECSGFSSSAILISYLSVVNECDFILYEYLSNSERKIVSLCRWHSFKARRRDREWHLARAQWIMSRRQGQQQRIWHRG